MASRVGLRLQVGERRRRAVALAGPRPAAGQELQRRQALERGRGRRGGAARARPPRRRPRRRRRRGRARRAPPPRAANGSADSNSARASSCDPGAPQLAQPHGGRRGQAGRAARRSSIALVSSWSAVGQSPCVARTAPYAVRQTPKKCRADQRTEKPCIVRDHCAARANSPTSAHDDTVWQRAQPGARASSNSSPTASVAASSSVRTPSATGPRPRGRCRRWPSRRPAGRGRRAPVRAAAPRSASSSARTGSAWCRSAMSASISATRPCSAHGSRPASSSRARRSHAAATASSPRKSR